MRLADEALVNFFDEKFPEYKSKDFYITVSATDTPGPPARSRAPPHLLSASAHAVNNLGLVRACYLQGESYAGTYIPMLMDVADKKGGLPNLKGAAIGDGCYGNSIGLCGNRYYEQRVDAEIFSGHAMYPLSLYSKITAVSYYLTS